MARSFAKWAGVVFLLLGITGFFAQGGVLGPFHFDANHNALHVAVGVWGLAVGGQEWASLLFTRVIGVLYMLLGTAGFFAPELFGLMHMDVASNVMHLIAGALGTYIGFVITDHEKPAMGKAA